jgi:hypothetical protein
MAKEIKLTKKQEKLIKQEVKERLHKRILRRTRGSALRFKKEFKKQIVIGITAAFAFLIALSWRTPIKNSVDILITNFGLGEKTVYFEYLSAIAITLIAVLCLMLISIWASKE